MTKKKPGAVKGRPKGSGEGLTEYAATWLTSEVSDAVTREAKSRGESRAVVLREIVTRWAKRQSR